MYFIRSPANTLWQSEVPKYIYSNNKFQVLQTFSAVDLAVCHKFLHVYLISSFEIYLIFHIVSLFWE